MLKSPVDNDDDVDSDSDDGIEIPSDPAHEARMAALRAENEQLNMIVEEQDRVLEEMAQRMREIQEATRQRQEELDLLAGSSCGAKISLHAKNQPSSSKTGNFSILAFSMRYHPPIVPTIRLKIKELSGWVFTWCKNIPACKKSLNWRF